VAEPDETTPKKTAKKAAPKTARKTAKTATKKRATKKKVDAASRGLAAPDVGGGDVPAEVAQLSADIEEDGGSVLAAYRDPLGSNWTLLAALPIASVAPTPFQRDLSAAHVKRLTGVIDTLDHFLDPIVVVRHEAGTYWTPNGMHRLAAVNALGGKSIVALVVPNPKIAYKILALNTEKAHNVKEKSLEVIRMARSLASLDDAPESAFALEFEEPALATLGACYEQRGRFAGSAYSPVLKRIEAFLDVPLAEAITVREARAATLLELDDAVAAAVDALEARGVDSPYLKAFVIARINPLRFSKGDAAPWDEVIGKMLDAARRFDPGKVSADQVAKAGGGPGD
jgi:ParB family chromosome partitioning protein